MFAIVLVHPEIPPNTGNVIRLTANTATECIWWTARFRMDDRELKRAGLDYHEYARVTVHGDSPRAAGRSTPSGSDAISRSQHRRRARRTTSRSRRATCSCSALKRPGCPSTCSRSSRPNARLRIPMRAGVRSLNLSNAVAVAVYGSVAAAAVCGRRLSQELLRRGLRRIAQPSARIKKTQLVVAVDTRC